MQYCPKFMIIKTFIKNKNKRADSFVKTPCQLIIFFQHKTDEN